MVCAVLFLSIIALSLIYFLEHPVPIRLALVLVTLLRKNGGPVSTLNNIEGRKRTTHTVRIRVGQ
jgi:hypothetical protein